MLDHDNLIVVGLLFGDEGKGTITSFLSKHDTNAVVKFSGGPQTAHNVVTPDGRHHTFAQFGAGSFHGVRTILSRFVLVDPLSLVTEGDTLIPKVGWDVFKPLLISENALMVTPIHAAINRKREIARGAAAHGSCGMGVGETRGFHEKHPTAAIRMTDLYDLETLREKLVLLHEYALLEVGSIDDYAPSVDELFNSYEMLSADHLLNVVSDDTISSALKEGRNVFEGSQGVLLDEDLGFHPHNTWSTTTQQNAQVLLKEAGLAPGHVVGVVRTYMTRHGAGPFPSEFAQPDWSNVYPEHHNAYGQFQGGWRAGYMDLALLEYAVRANKGIDSLAVTHVDVPTSKLVAGYQKFPNIPTDYYGQDWDSKEQLTKKLFALTENDRFFEHMDSPIQLFRALSDVSGARVRITSSGPTNEDKRILP